jgi:hypothetical protein
MSVYFTKDGLLMTRFKRKASDSLTDPEARHLFHCYPISILGHYPNNMFNNSALQDFPPFFTSSVEPKTLVAELPKEPFLNSFP